MLTGLWGMGSLIYAQSISEKNLHRALSFIHSKVIQHVLTVVLDGLGISSLGFLTIMYPNRCWQWKWDKEQAWISKLYGCMFPGSLCHTQTETDGNIYILGPTSPIGRWCNPIFCEGWWMICIDFTTNFVCFFFCSSKALCHNPVRSCTC